MSEQNTPSETPGHGPLTLLQKRDIGYIRQTECDLKEVFQRMAVAPDSYRNLGPGPFEGKRVLVDSGERHRNRAISALEDACDQMVQAVTGRATLPSASEGLIHRSWEEADKNATEQGRTLTPSATR